MPTTQEYNTYRLDRMKATPYPNRLLELTLKLSEPQARMVNLLVRSTLGWHGGTPGIRKASAYFTKQQLRNMVGDTSMAGINRALAELIAIGIIELLDSSVYTTNQVKHGSPLHLRIARKYVEE